MNDILGAVITFAVGAGIATLNYYISKFILEKKIILHGYHQFLKEKLKEL